VLGCVLLGYGGQDCDELFMCPFSSVRRSEQDAALGKVYFVSRSGSTELTEIWYLVSRRGISDCPKDMGKQTSGNDTGAFTDFTVK
jgi:hypothetical protein